ncbi:MAG: tRNA (guanosine(46)-N7)-methyltransferase TrmB [Clostridia bacterium]|nr:tRNA (guanosine(46)-N7)-methyltransferase TrmB [Clostridia bacterium]
MRIRRKPWAKPELERCNFFIKNPDDFLGIWSKQFSKGQPIHLELGCGKGVFISKLAPANPMINFLAIDIKDEVLVLAKRNIEKEFLRVGKDINNVLLMAYDINRISLILNEKDVVDRIYINFCNPWPRRKHHKRRLTHPRQLSQYCRFLKPLGEIFFKTDDEELFSDSIKYFNENKFEIILKTKNLHELNYNFSENIQTEHEKMFIEQNVPIKFLIAKYKKF